MVWASWWSAKITWCGLMGPFTILIPSLYPLPFKVGIVKKGIGETPGSLLLFPHDIGGVQYSSNAMVADFVDVNIMWL